MESNQRRVISLLVDNQSGVLARVSSLFCRRGFNIDSLTVSATNDPAVSRITVTITSDEKALQQLVLQTERLEVGRAQPHRAAGDRLHLQGKDHRSFPGQHGL